MVLKVHGKYIKKIFALNLLVYWPLHKLISKIFLLTYASPVMNEFLFYFY